MERQKVESSMIESVGYEGDVLHVEFNTGAVYEYKGVPVEVYQELMSVSSKGTFFSKRIRNEYEGKRIDGNFDYSD